MALLSLRNVTLSYGGQSLFDGIQCHVQMRERIALVGRNGVGKSTLLKIIAGLVEADSGQVEWQQDLRVSYLPQEPVVKDQQTVAECLLLAADKVGPALLAYQELVGLDSLTDQQQQQLLDHQHVIDEAHAWPLWQRVKRCCEDLDIGPDIQLGSLSGGRQKQVMLLRTFINDPDLVLLDEPTNHLDIPSIQWLEKFILGFAGTVIFISHDRCFMQNLSTRICEIDFGELLSWSGDYQTYLKQKSEWLNAKELADKRFANKLAQEEVWIRQGIKARRTRNEGRVRTLKSMRVTAQEQRKNMQKPNFDMQSALRTGKVLFDIKDIDIVRGDLLLLKSFSTLVSKGDKVAIVGRNGIGKSSLIKALLGELSLRTGEINTVKDLKIAYFDQSKAGLNMDMTVIDNMDTGDQVCVDGKTQHILSYLQNFLFSPERSRQYVKDLSGGEKTRLLLAKMFLHPYHLLVLDEPTNDLDCESLELLEDLLVQYKGTVLLISHDRSFIDAISTRTWVLHGHGKLTEHNGGFL